MGLTITNCSERFTPVYPELVTRSTRRIRVHAVVRPMRRIGWTIAIASALLVASFTVALRARADGSDRIHWKQVPEAQVKLDDKTPLAWSVYQPVKDKKDKKASSTLVLILLGHRYLMLNLKDKTVYEVEPPQLQAQGSDFESSDLADPSHAIGTSDWDSRDVGPEQLYKLTLGDYGRVLQVTLPHPLDLRLGLY